MPSAMKSLVDGLSPLDPPVSPADIKRWGREHGWQDHYTGMLMGVANFLLLPGGREHLARLNFDTPGSSPSSHDPRA
jgi:hypothetical protein